MPCHVQEDPTPFTQATLTVLIDDAQTATHRALLDLLFPSAKPEVKSETKVVPVCALRHGLCTVSCCVLCTVLCASCCVLCTVLCASCCALRVVRFVPCVYACVCACHAVGCRGLQSHVPSTTRAEPVWARCRQTPLRITLCVSCFVCTAAGGGFLRSARACWPHGWSE